MRLLPNTSAIFILGVIVGWAINVNFIGAQAYFISQLPPLYTIYLGVAYGLLFSLFLRGFRLKRLKFSAFFIISVLAFLACHALLLLSFDLAPVWKAGVWFFLALTGISFFKWVIFELAIKYLDPPRAQAYFSYLTTADEIGVLLAAGSLWWLGMGTSADQLIVMVMALFALVAGFVAYQFLPEKNFEIRFTKKTLSPPVVSEKVLKTFMWSFIALTICFGAVKTGEEYLVRLVLKENLGGFEAIKQMISRYTFAAGALTILGSLVIGKLSQERRISPIRLLQLHACFLLAAVALCWFLPTLIFFVALEVTRLVTSNCFHRSATQTIIASFISEFRKRFGAVYNFYFFIVAGFPLAIIFTYTNRLPYLEERTVVLFSITLFLVLSFPIIYALKKALIALQYEFVASGHKTAAINAVQALSFLRPVDFGDRMQAMLRVEPKKILRKTIILGLGHLHRSDTIDMIIREFQSDKEIIQIAVLDALRVSRHYKATQFMFKILSVREKPKSLNVRMHATFIIAGMYGKKSIPILLNEIDNPEPRIVANILETLALFKDEALVPYFQKFLKSANTRIRANALMGLGLIRSTKRVYREQIDRLFEEHDPKTLASVLYVIGKIADKKSLTHVESVYNSTLRENMTIKPLLAWALIKLNDSRGYDLFGEIFSLPYQESVEQRVLNLFSQLKKEKRFDVIKHLVLKNRGNASLIFNLANNLRHSPFNYYEEVEFIHFLSEELRLGPAPAIPAADEQLA